MTESRKGPWHQTFTGKKFYPLDPRPDDICIEDIAHSLSLQCRYLGHCKKFYSVADHSIIVSNILLGSYGWTESLYGLLHDAAEAYVGDMCRPVKIGSELGRLYSDVEEKIQACVLEKFRLPAVTEPEYVKIVDARVLATEVRTMMGDTSNWSLLEPYEFTIVPRTSVEAESDFLNMFKKLTEKRLK